MIDEQDAIRAALVSLQAACGLPSGDNGTDQLIRTLSDTINLMGGLVAWCDSHKDDPEGSLIDLLVECIDSSAEFFRPDVIEGINVDL